MLKRGIAKGAGKIVLFVALIAGGAAMAEERTKFLLVHGAWHVGSAWDGVISELDALGHNAEAITLPGHGKDADRAGITLSDSENMLLETLAAQDGPVILVGHSAAGVLLQNSAGKAADKIAGVVFHNAFLVPGGTSLFDALPPDIAAIFKQVAEASEDNSLGVDEGFWRHVLLAGVEEDKATEIIAEMVPQPFGYYTQNVDTSSFDTLDRPKFLLLATGDHSLPQEAWKGMSMLAGRVETVEITGGHEVIYTDPAAVAEGLSKIAGMVSSLDR